MFHRVTAPHDLTISVVAYFCIVCISAYHRHRRYKQHGAEHISAFSIFPHINYALGISSQEILKMFLAFLPPVTNCEFLME